MLIAYISLFIVSFAAASLLPAQSEFMLGALIASQKYNIFLLLVTATLGNTAGACFNWWLGKYITKFEGRRWFPFTRAQLNKAQAAFNKYGRASLLFSWLPIAGDPLTFAAGVLNVPFKVFLPLVLIGKAARYIALAAFTYYAVDGVLKL